MPHTDPVPPNTSKYRPILTQYHHISMSLNVPRNKFPRDNVSRDNVSRDNVPLDNFPRDNCSSLQCPSQQCPSRKLFLVTIVPQFLYKWSFAKRRVLRMTKIKGTEEDGLLQIIIRMIWPPLCSSVSLQMVISAQTANGSGVKAKWLTNIDNEVRWQLPVRWTISRVIVFATIVAVFAFYNWLEKEKQRSEFK